MGNNQALQVAAEALSGLAAGLLAAIIVKLPLLVLGATSILSSNYRCHCDLSGDGCTLKVPDDLPGSFGMPRLKSQSARHH